jgi:hypothetical protein
VVGVLGLGRKESSFSEEKEAKRLSPFAPAPGRKSFLVLFFKKEHALFEEMTPWR